MTDRRTRKRLATRRAISDAATRLIYAKGFDKVTIDEVAEAADVGRMTVFNHFPRKEDMFFDRRGEMQAVFFDAITTRTPDTSPIEALRLLAHRLIEQPDPSLPVFEGSQRFVETALASEALKARARQMRAEFAHALATLLADIAGHSGGDVNAGLAAELIAATWATAFLHGHALRSTTGDIPAAERLFLELVDRGSMGAKAALANTPYA